jgi:hypothetical protein
MRPAPISARFRRGVAAVGENMDDNVGDAFALGHCKERVKVGVVGVDAAVADEAHEMEAARAGVGHGGFESGIVAEIAVADHPVDAGDVHLDDAAGADVEMADFGVAHLAIGEADGFATRMDERIGEVPDEGVEDRRVGGEDGVALDGCGVAPAVEDGENNRRFGH